MKESSYFFRMQNFKEELLKLIHETRFIEPESAKHSILKRLEDDLLVCESVTIP